MKQKLLLLFVPLFLYAEAFLISDIPLPKSTVFDLDPYPCDEKCLKEYLDKGLIFSFIAKATHQPVASKELKEAKKIYVSIFNLGLPLFSANKLKIAMLLPYRTIGKYATTTTNAVLAYLIAKNIPFELQSFMIESEEYEEIQKALEKIQKEGFGYIIAPVTIKGAKNILNFDPQSMVYFPTIHKDDIANQNPNFLFGAIDYKAQSKMLLNEARSPLVIFYDRSYIGEKLTNIQEDIFLADIAVDELITKIEPKEVIKYPIASRTSNLERELKDNSAIINASIMLDTPLVKSGMIMSQLTLYEIEPINILSTQINYDPLLLSITQYEDRKNMIIANSITQKNKVLIETNALLGNDINYDWINYTTTIGIDYIVHQITGVEREYSIELQENQFLYPVELKQPSYSRFINYEHIDDDLL